MNQISKILENKIAETFQTAEMDEINGVREGFHFAIDLNLPIKFAYWIKENAIECSTGYILAEGFAEYDDTEFQIEELYDFWINNIYKP